MSTKSTQQHVLSPSSTTKSQKPADSEETFMRKVMMFFVISLCILSEAASLVIFFYTNHVGSFEMAIALQLLPLLCVYKILNYLFPGPGLQDNLLVVLAKLILKHP